MGTPWSMRSVIVGTQNEWVDNWSGGPAAFIHRFTMLYTSLGVMAPRSRGPGAGVVQCLSRFSFRMAGRNFGDVLSAVFMQATSSY